MKWFKKNRSFTAGVVIIFMGAAVAAGVLAFSHFNMAEPALTTQPLQWTDQTGQGISIPACGSASYGVTCSGGAPVVTFDWTDTTRVCDTRLGNEIGVRVTPIVPPGTWTPIENRIVTECSPNSFTWTGASSNTSYEYYIVAATVPVSHFVNFSTFTTPNCAIPTADIKANSSDGPITITYNTSATLSWSSTNATSCSASGSWSGSKPTSGTEPTGNLTSSQTYSLSCTGPGGTSPIDSVTVNVNPPPNLVISSGPTLASGSLIAGQSVTFSGVVTNSGASTAGGTFTNRFHIDLSDNGTRDVELGPPDPAISALPSSSSQGVTSASWTAVAGTHRVVICADQPSLTVTESSESDNCSPTTGSVGVIVVTSSPNNAPIANASISTDGISYFDSITVIKGVATPIYLAASSGAGVSLDPDGWDDPNNGVSPGGRCEWNSDLNQGAPTFETTINNPAYPPSSCNISLGSLTFNDPAGTYTYNVLRIFDTPGAVSNTDTVSVTVSNQAPVIPSMGPAHSTTVGSSHAHSGASATDPNNNLASYTWLFTACPGVCPLITAGDSGSISGGSASITGPTYTPSVADAYTLRLRVFDTDSVFTDGFLTETALTPSSLIATLTAAPSSGIAPLTTTLTAGVSGGVGTINYALWWNCDSPATTMAAAETACGAMPAASPGSCVPNGSIGVRCNTMSAETQSVSHTYLTVDTYRPKVVVERGSSPPDEERTTVTATNPVTQCSDGIDNETVPDGKIDFGTGPTNDPSCSSLGDNDETNPPQCSDGIDNDGDTRIDFTGPNPDPGCSSLSDNTESNIPLPTFREIPPQ